MPIQYIGRESYFHGKSLYEIARNLKNFGVGRYVYRVTFSKRYEEPSFYKLTSVQPDMNAKGYSKGKAEGEKYFRGRHFGNCKIEAGPKHDWRLIPKDQEHMWLNALEKCEIKPPKEVSNSCEIPPLMKKIFSDEINAAGLVLEKSAFLCKKKIHGGKFCNYTNTVEQK